MGKGQRAEGRGQRVKKAMAMADGEKSRGQRAEGRGRRVLYHRALPYDIGLRPFRAGINAWGGCLN